jgi:tryptophan-rich sensory protein
MARLARQYDLGWLGGFLAASAGAAALGGLFTARSVDSWYRTLRKPAWTPPDWVFGPVWTALYTLIGLAAWLVRRGATHPRRGQEPAGAGDAAQTADVVRPALATWGVQLGLNVLWSAVFFGARRTGGGLWVIGALWAAIAACAALSARVTRLAGLVLLPYLAWTTFAAALNARIWQLNRA